jgi:hypothetical protein
MRDINDTADKPLPGMRKFKFLHALQTAVARPGVRAVLAELKRRGD